jgi:hypothetical protein
MRFSNRKYLRITCLAITSLQFLDRSSQPFSSVMHSVLVLVAVCILPWLLVQTPLENYLH